MISGTFKNGEGRKFPATISEHIWHVLGHCVRKYALKEFLVEAPMAIAGSYKTKMLSFRFMDEDRDLSVRHSCE